MVAMLNALALFFVLLPLALFWGADNLPGAWGTVAFLGLPVYAVLGLVITVGYIEDHHRGASD